MWLRWLTRLYRGSRFCPAFATPLEKLQFLDFRLKLCQSLPKIICVGRLGSPQLLNVRTKSRSGNRAKQGSNRYCVLPHELSISPATATRKSVSLHTTKFGQIHKKASLSVTHNYR